MFPSVSHTGAAENRYQRPFILTMSSQDTHLFMSYLIFLLLETGQAGFFLEFSVNMSHFKSSVKGKTTSRVLS